MRREGCCVGFRFRVPGWKFSRGEVKRWSKTLRFVVEVGFRNHVFRDEVRLQKLCIS